MSLGFSIKLSLWNWHVFFNTWFVDFPSFQANCGGLGLRMSSCFPSLQANCGGLGLCMSSWLSQFTSKLWQCNPTEMERLEKTAKQEKPRKERNLLHEQEKPRKERNLLHCSHTHNLVTTCISPFLFVFVVSMVLKQPPPPPPHWNVATHTT